LILVMMLLAWSQSGPVSLEATRARVGREQARLSYLRRQEAATGRDLTRLAATIRDRERQSKRLERDLVEARERVQEAQLQLQGVAERLRAVEARAGRRARALLALQTGALDRALLGITDPVRLRRTEDRWSFVLRADARVAQRIRELQERHRSRIQVLDQAVRSLEQTQAQLADERSALETARAELEVLARALGQERRVSRQLTRLLRGAEARLRSAPLRQRTLPARVPGGFAAQRGRLPWPLDGRIEVPFGPRVHPRTGAVLPHSGIDVRAPPGTPVRAVFDGVVRRVQREPQLATVVVVEHDGGFFSVYAYLDRASVAPEQRLQQGAELGHIGPDASHKGAYAFFGLRQGNTVLDPLAWLAP
jgi:murein DD-endopeptidase MepM/ murein hydrolase activator NlpD